jgi:transposase-like protein
MSTPFSLPTVKRTWSADDIRMLRELSQQGVPVAIIARRLGRTESAIRNKAAMHGVPVRSSARAASAIPAGRAPASQRPA